MDITTLKQQARVLEQKGDTAGALEAFRRIIAQLVKSGIEPEGPLFVKAGDLTLKTGNRQGAVAMFERAAARYASMGSAKSVIALCLKILRTDPLQKDVHVRYARQLFGRGHVEPARLVLLDYAERSQLHKTHQTLGRLANRSVPEITVKLQEFFDTVDRGVRMTGERRVMSAPPFSARRSETAEHLAVMADAIMRKDPAVPASPGETAPFTVDHPEVQPTAAPDPAMAELKRSASPAPAQQRPAAVSPSKPAQVGLAHASCADVARRCCRGRVDLGHWAHGCRSSPVRRRSRRGTASRPDFGRTRKGRHPDDGGNPRLTLVHRRARYGRDDSPRWTAGR
jgi:hypothetical protein